MRAKRLKLSFFAPIIICSLRDSELLRNPALRLYLAVVNNLMNKLLSSLLKSEFD